MKALLKKPDCKLEVVEGVKNSLEWIRKRSNIINIGHLCIDNYCFIFDDLGAYHSLQTKQKYNCNIITSDNLIFGDLYITKYDDSGDDIDINDDDIIILQSLIFTLDVCCVNKTRERIIKQYGIYREREHV